MNSVSVIICTYKRQKWVEDLLISIAQQTVSPKEIIIVDSTPETINYSCPIELQVETIKSDRMQLTYQRNLGVKAANGEIMLHIDDDTVLETDFIEQILNVFEADKEKAIGAVSGYITNQWGSLKIAPNDSHKLFKWLRIYDGDYSPGSISPSGIFIELNAFKPFSGIKKTDFISGCSFGVRAEVYKKHEHPEMIRKHGGEDKTFSRMIAAEWDLCICGDAKLEHFSALAGARPKDFTHARSTVKIHTFIQKNYGSNKKRTLNLRFYFILLSLRLYVIALAMLLTVLKARKSMRWFARASGYVTGALTLTYTKNE